MAAQHSTAFLSYAGADAETAAMVVAGLLEAGVSVWWDRGRIDWGGNWIDELQQGLTQAAAYLILVGRSGIRRWVKLELDVALKRHVDDGLPIFTLLLPGVRPEDLPPFLATVQARAIPLDPSAADFTALAQALQRPRPPAPAVPVQTTGREPFPGLEAYQRADAPFFFGRELETLQALKLFGPTPGGGYNRWLQVEGGSGTGKSSLVRAGLLPAISGGWLGEDEGRRPNLHWDIAVPMRPGTQPLLNLATTLAEPLGADVQTLDRAFRDTTNDAGRALLLALRDRRRVPPDHGVVLVVDQFEELFTLVRDPDLRTRFDALLGNALADLDGPLHLITTIRTDFLHRLCELPQLRRMLAESSMGRYLLLPIDARGLTVVVESAVRAAGLRWSDEELPQEIIAEAADEPGALPLVANLLRLMWQRRSPEGVLSRHLYTELGGVGGALATSADRLLTTLEPADGEERARCLLLALVEPIPHGQAVRRTISKAAALRAARGGPAAEQVLYRLAGGRAAGTPEQAWAAPRLISLSTHASEGAPAAAEGAKSASDNEDRVAPPRAARPEAATPAPADAGTPAAHDDQVCVDLAHEALLRSDRNGKPYWAKLSTWVEAARKELELRQLLERLASGFGAGQTGLARGRELRAFRTLLKGCAALSPSAERYLRLSMRMARMRLLGALSGLAVLLVGAGILATFALWIERTQMRPAMALYVLAGKAGWILKQPEMIDLRPGEPPHPQSFWMGSVPGDPVAAANEQPRHRVSLARPFAIGRYEVTFDEYELFARLTGRPVPPDEGWGRERRPIINVSWDDAAAYAHWLAESTGEPYRLPTEAEWEYAARGGTTGRHWWCKDTEPNCAVTADVANCAGCTTTLDIDGFAVRTIPVGSLKPNPFGLHDTAGNVFEWVLDCWHPDYAGAPWDGGAWQDEDNGDCHSRIVRGGSYNFEPRDLRVSQRVPLSHHYFREFFGFRLARDL
jgi:formylglycine-generating enzyme required for sulfatase activity